MKNYRITVNGVAYDVAVEELGAGEASAHQQPLRLQLRKLLQRLPEVPVP